MWHRSAVAAALVLAASVPASAQVANVYSRAIPPDKTAIERLNLKIEWTANIPVEGRRDSLTQIQPIDDQVFVQTRTGYLIAGDALTGRLQWFVQLGNGEFANSYPVAANSQFVFVAHVTKLHCFHRYTGVVEFVTDLGSPPTAGLAADESGVYCILGMRTGNSGSHRISVYNLPRPIAILDAQKKPVDATEQPLRDQKTANPVDDLMGRYSPPMMSRTNLPDTFDALDKSKLSSAPLGGLTGGRTPSLSVLNRVTPPYSLDNGAYTPSLDVLPSLRQPYRLRNDYQRDIQQTPSLGALTPTLAGALAGADLRPKNVEPKLRWEYGFNTRILFQPFLTPTRVWVATDGNLITALSKRDKKVEVVDHLADPISAFPGRAGLFAYVPLGSGYVVAVEGSSGTSTGGANILWRTPVGGICNRTPFVTEKFVYAAGDNSGVVCIRRVDGPGKDERAGEIIWKSDNSADRVIAANQEFVYIRDRQGRFLVYDAKRATDPARKYSAPLAGMNLAEFNVNVVNAASDRIYLAADNGLIVCLRDLNKKYTLPVRISPEPMINEVPKAEVTIVGKDGTAKNNDAPPKVEPEPKKD